MTEYPVVGQKVVCIATGDWKKVLSYDPACSVPKRGNIYTIREIYLDPYSGSTGIRLVEIVNALGLYLGTDRLIERGWCLHEFKPLEEKKTNISIFTRMLTGNKVHADT